MEIGTVLFSTILLEEFDFYVNLCYNKKSNYKLYSHNKEETLMSTSKFEKFMQKSGKNGIRNVALDYAYKGDTITFSVLSEKYGISKKVIQDCVEYAIVNCLIDYDEVILIKEKSHRNQAIHFRNTPVRTQSDRYYEDLLQRRLRYVENLEVTQVIEIAYLYIANPKMSCKELAKELHFSSKEVNLIIKNAIVNNLVEEGVIRHIYAVSLMKSTSAKNFNYRSDYFKKLEDVRKGNITSALKDEAHKQLREIDSHLDQLLSQFQGHQDYISSEDVTEGYSSYDEFDYKIFRLRQKREKLLSYLN